MNFDVGRPLETPRSWHAAALTVAVLLPSATTALYFIVLSGSQAMGVVYGLSKIVQFAFPLGWVLAVQKRRLRIARPEGRQVAMGLFVGAAMVATGLAAYFLYFKTSPWLVDLPRTIGEKLRDMRLVDVRDGASPASGSPVRFLAFAMFLSVPHSLAEEYYWRWFVFGQARRVMPLGAAVALSSLGFMAHHVLVIEQFLPGQWAAVVTFSACVACGGAVWAVMYQRLGSLYASWAGHFLVDAGIMAIGYDLVWRT